MQAFFPKLFNINPQPSLVQPTRLRKNPPQPRQAAHNIAYEDTETN